MDSITSGILPALAGFPGPGEKIIALIFLAFKSSNFRSSFLYTKSYPDPDLLIRTSGELRISNFLLWQCAYTEMYLTNTYWPSFRERDLFKAIIDFQSRERRFGKISEQVNS